MKHVLSLRELDADALSSVVASAAAMKADRSLHADALSGLGQVVLNAKTSTRTTLSFSTAMAQLGGFTTRLDWRETNLTISPLEYEGRYISSNCDVIMARLRSFAEVQELASVSSVPVINGCCNTYHPSQAVADVLTISEVAGRLPGASVAYVGVHNNVTNSLVVACTRLGVRIGLVTPKVNDVAWDEELMAEAEATGLVERYETVAAAAAACDFIYTDTWVDMEFFADETLLAERSAEMAPYQLSRANLAGADPWIMHDMPIHPGFEIEAELVDSPRSVIFRQAENRLYAAKALLLHCLA